MTARPNRERRVSRSRRWAEYFFLILGLVAIDCFIWTRANAVVYQGYESWALDQQLAGSQPSVGGFIQSRADLLLGRKLPKPAGVERAPAPNKAAPQKEVTRQNVWTPRPSEVIGRVSIPRLHLRAVVREGVDAATLREAVGHIPSTALPGQLGNAAFAGHRDTFFRGLRNIRKDDLISVTTLKGTYKYIVESLSIVRPTDVSVLNASGGEQLLTLVTCYPFNYIGAAPDRYIVRARRVESGGPSPPQAPRQGS